jgi:adenylate kinase
MDKIPKEINKKLKEKEKGPAMKLIFLGPPGAGKGTIAVKVSEILKAPAVSTGAIFRAAIAADSALGRTVRDIIAGGKLVDDKTTVALVKERLGQDDVKDAYILDGFPRTIAQAQALAEFSPVDQVVNFDIPDTAVLERLSGRRVCRQCGSTYHTVFHKPQKDRVCDTCGGEVYTRDDDREETVRERLVVYREQTAPLIDFYRRAGLLVDVNAQPGIAEVLAAFKNALRIP